MKHLAIWLLLGIFILGEARINRLFAQSVSFPEIKIKKKGEFVDQKLWIPSTKFLGENPDFFKNGTYRFRQPGLTGLTSQNYRADLVKGSRIVLQNMRLIVCFPAGNLKSQGADENNSVSSIPLNQYEVYSDTGLYNHAVNALDDYHKLDEEYIQLVNASLLDKYNGDLKILPIGSQYLDGLSLKVKDFFLELNYNGKCKISSEEDYAYLYTLKIRDCSGKVLKKYGQAVFVSQMPNELPFIEITKIAVDNLINQFSVDKTGNEITSRLNSLKIKYVDDSNFIRRFVYINQANYYHLAQKNILFQLKDISSRITALGGSGLDMSSLSMPINSSNSASANVAGATVEAGAELAATVINDVKIAKLNKLKKEADEEVGYLNYFRNAELRVVNNYNRLIGWRGNNDVGTDRAAESSNASFTNTNSNSYGSGSGSTVMNTGSASKKTASSASGNNIWNETENSGTNLNRNTTTQNNNSTDVWNENGDSSSQPSVHAHKAKHTHKASNSNGVWSENAQSYSTENSAEQNNSGQQIQLKPLQISSDNIQQDAAQYGSDINQKATQSINQINITNQANLNTMQSTVSSVTAASTNGGNSASPTGSSSDQSLLTPQCKSCSDGVNEENERDMNNYKNKGMNTTQREGLELQRTCIQRYLNECNSCLTPKEKSVYQQTISNLNTEINDLGSGVVITR